MDDLVKMLRDPRYMGQEGMREKAADEIERLRAALKDMTMRVENSWERRDLAPDTVAAAKRLYSFEQGTPLLREER